VAEPAAIAPSRSTRLIDAVASFDAQEHAASAIFTHDVLLHRLAVMHLADIPMNTVCPLAYEIGILLRSAMVVGIALVRTVD
jgi:hypothetical protein